VADGVRDNDHVGALILDGAFIVTAKGIRATKPCVVCGRPFNNESFMKTCSPCFDYYGTSLGEIVRNCEATGTLRPRR
jgi:hypothetical protein